MKSQPSTQREVVVPDNVQLISTTDIKGQILYANEAFCQVSGFSLDELRNRPHNIVRHADMPKEAFGNLWESLKNDQAWRGIVKNRCKNGDHYWVDAYVTPLYENGTKIGYQSVRVRPSDQQKQKAERLYAQINQGKLKSLISNRSVNKAATLISGGVACAGMAGAFLVESPFLNAALTGLTAAGIIGTWIWHTRQLASLKQVATDISSNELIRLVYCDSNNELGDIQLAMTMQEARNRTVLGRLADINSTIKGAVDQTDSAIQKTDSGISRQNSETDQVANAVGQMAEATQEIAENIQQTSSVSQNACSVTDDGRHALQGVIDKTGLLASHVKLASETTLELQKQADEIGHVLAVINDIADQTNLLALNAAIEAARAGEAGRGFAVVADEVRSLASKTGDSANEIHAMIRQLQNTAENAVSAMEQGIGLSSSCKERANQTGDVLNTISAKLNLVTDSSIQIACAVEQQAQVTQEINRNITNIKTLADGTSEISHTSLSRIKQLVDRLEGLERLMRQFKA